MKTINHGNEIIKIYPTLVLLCKRPAFGYGKQRLAQDIGQKQALAIAKSLLACALEDLSCWPGKVVISPSRSADCVWAAGLLTRPVQVVAQESGNLGERINRLDSFLKAAGYAQTIYIGSDAPILGRDEYQQIATALQVYDIALCPALDGGVAIMANRRPWPDLRALEWSTARLGEQLKNLCAENNLAVHCIKAGYDLDNYQQVAKLAEDLQYDSRDARQKLLQQLNQL
jgi:hypothetical protein